MVLKSGDRWKACPGEMKGGQDQLFAAAHGTKDPSSRPLIEPLHIPRRSCQSERVAASRPVLQTSHHCFGEMPTGAIPWPLNKYNVNRVG
jgi:hypothetical protein